MCTFLKDENDYDDSGLHIKRITKDIGFWKECVEKARNFFTICLLLEILGNWYTKPTFKKCFNSLTDDATPGTSGIGNDSAKGSDSVPGDRSCTVHIFCYYHGPEKGDMIACDNHDCVIEWFISLACKWRDFLKAGPSGIAQIAEYYHSFKFVGRKVLSIE